MEQVTAAITYYIFLSSQCLALKTCDRNFFEMLLINNLILFSLFTQHGLGFTIGELEPILETLKDEIREEFKSELEGISTKLTNDLAMTGEIVTAVQDQGNQIDKMKSDMKFFEKWTRLVTVQETCAQLSLLGLVLNGKKEWIDPDGRSTGQDPIEVSIFH